MPPLPVVSGKEAARVLEKLGWVFNRQRGSHMIFKKEGFRRPITIPNHTELDRGTLRSILRDANISVDQFIETLNNL